jgi:hypothetical protein
MAAVLTAAAVPSEIGVLDQPREDDRKTNQQSQPKHEAGEQRNECHRHGPH